MYLYVSKCIQKSKCIQMYPTYDLGYYQRNVDLT